MHSARSISSGLQIEARSWYVRVRNPGRRRGSNLGRPSAYPQEPCHIRRFCYAKRRRYPRRGKLYCRRQLVARSLSRPETRCAEPAQWRERRALVHGFNDELVVNFAGDYPGGVTIRGAISIPGKIKQNHLRLESHDLHLNHPDRRSGASGERSCTASTMNWCSTSARTIRAA